MCHQEFFSHLKVIFQFFRPQMFRMRAGGDAFSVVSQTFLGWAIGGKLLTFWVASLVK